jgi:demethylmenaquinone methyltransferase/2-methoxy-6-polyprenyl-1,4-benzoquinol methylase
LEITKPRGRITRALLRTYMRGIVPLLARALSRHRDMPQLMRYYWDTIEACAPPERILAEIRAAGFLEVNRYVEAGVFSEYRARKAS